jgi:AcrR family transcriptional regulator
MVSEVTRRQQIENTASALFRERGYAGTSVRDIAKALDIQGASLYAHVASKEDVLWSIVLRAADRFDAAVTPLAADATTSPSVRLARMITAHIGVIADDLGNATSFLQEWRFLSPDRRQAIGERRDGYEARFRGVIEEGVAAGELDPGIDPHLAATLILSALNGVAGWYRPSGSLSPSQIAERYVSMLLGGLRGRPDSIYPDAESTMRTLR